MSAPPRADFVAGCPDCGQSKGADDLDVVAGFYTCHRCEGHDVEWMWGHALTLDVDPDVTSAGTVANLRSVIHTLEDHFEPATVPGELLYETCLNAGAAKGALDDQFDQLPATVTDRVTLID